jgi:hypothetical protein
VGEVPVPPTPEEMMAAQQMGVMPEPRMEPSLCLRCEDPQG